MTDTPISQYETLIKRGVSELRAELDRVQGFLGDRPLLRSKLTMADQYAAYREMRQQPFAIYGMMDMVWQEIEARLAGVGETERNAKGLDQQATRELAMLEVLQHCDKMLRYEMTLGRSEDTTPPAAIDEQPWSGDEWDSSTS